MPLNHGVTLPMPDEAAFLDLRRAMLDAHAMGDPAKSCAFGPGTAFAVPPGLTKVPPQAATPGLVIPDQGVDPLVANAHADQGGHEAADLLGTPLLAEPSGDEVHQAG